MDWENQKAWPLAGAEAVTEIHDSTNIHGDLKGVGAVAPLTSCGCGQGKLPGAGIALGSVCMHRKNFQTDFAGVKVQKWKYTKEK